MILIAATTAVQAERELKAFLRGRDRLSGSRHHNGDPWTTRLGHRCRRAGGRATRSGRSSFADRNRHEHRRQQVQGSSALAMTLLGPDGERAQRRQYPGHRRTDHGLTSRELVLTWLGRALRAPPAGSRRSGVRDPRLSGGFGLRSSTLSLDGCPGESAEETDRTHRSEITLEAVMEARAPSSRTNTGGLSRARYYGAAGSWTRWRIWPGPGQELFGAEYATSSPSPGPRQYGRLLCASAAWRQDLGMALATRTPDPWAA